MSLNRRGFLLIELVVASLLSGLLAILIGGIVWHSAARLRDRSERMALEQSLRVSLGAAQTMIEPLGSDSIAGADLALPAPSSLIARVVRGSGVLCEAAEDHILARAGPGWWQAVRGLVRDRDSLLIAAVAGPDHWIAVPLRANPSPATCPDGTAAWLLPTVLPLAALTAVGEGSPLRAFEPVELRFYASAGASWVGLRLVATGEAIQPLAGPFALLAPSFGYQNRQGAPAFTASEVSVVTLGLAGVTERAGGVGLARLQSGGSDTAMVTLLLRGTR